jgi:hypothetical protein
VSYGGFRRYPHRFGPAQPPALTALSAVGARSGAAEIVLAGVALAGAGSVLVSGSAQPALDPVTLAGTGTVTIAGAALLTLGDTTLAGTGTVAGGSVLNVTLDGVGLQGRQADVLSFTVPSGTGRLTYTFDDLSTQEVTVLAGPYTVPTNLNRPRIRQIAGSASDSSTVLGSDLLWDWDVQDSATMFSDFAGTPAVIGTSVALQLDKTYGGTTTPTEKITNGDFSGGTTGWAAFDANATIAVVSGELQVTAAGAGSFPRATQTISGLVIGKGYLLTATARRGTTASTVYISPISGQSGATTSTSNQAIECYFVATANSMQMQFGILSGSATGTAYFDNISVVEAPDYELKSRGTLAVFGSATAATYNTSTGQGTAVRVDASNMSYVTWLGLGASRIYRITISNTGATLLQIRTGAISGGSSLMTIAAGVTATVYALASTGGQISILPNADAATIAFTITSFKEVLGTQRYQTDSTKRAIYSRHPKGGRRNLGTQTAAPAGGVNWFPVNASLGASGTTDLFGTTTAALVTADGSSNLHYAYAGNATNVSFVSGTTYSFSYWVKAGTQSLVQLTAATVAFGAGQYANFNLATGAVTGSTGCTAYISAAVNGWYRISIVLAATATAAAPYGSLVFIASGSDTRLPTNSLATTLHVAACQPEIASTPSNLQVVTTTYNCTETGVPDCYFLLPDGVNDFYVSTSIDLTAVNEIAVFAALRKTLGNSGGAFIEFSASSASNNGTFAIFAPNGTGADYYAWRSKGTTNVDAPISGYPVPSTVVLTGLGDISAPSSKLRLNGSEVSSVGTTQGTGNFGSYQIYSYMRGGTSTPFGGNDYGISASKGIPSSVQIDEMEFYRNNLVGAY